jgi:hypothetical protein
LTLRVFSGGAGPLVDTSIFTEDLPAGALAATFTDLTPDAPYSVYLNSNCSGDLVSELATLNLEHFPQFQLVHL